MNGSSSLRGTGWILPLIGFAATWEMAARLAQRPLLFPTFVDTVGSMPSLLSTSLAGAALNSLISVVIGYLVAAALALAMGAALRQSGGLLQGLRSFVWLAVIFLSLGLMRLAFEGLGAGANAVYVVGGTASLLLMLALLSSGVAGLVVLDLGLVAAWVGVLSAEAVAGGQTIGALVHRAGQDGPPERFYALCLLAALLGLALVAVVEAVATRLDLAKTGGRR